MSDLLRKEYVANWMFENRMCTSINNAYDKLKEIPTVDLADHDKQIKDEVISEMLKQVEFEEKWLSDAWQENGYEYSSRDVDMAFSGIKHKLVQLKGEQNVCN